MTTGLLLINLGTPDSPTISGVWRYLRVFLADKRVVDVPVILRYLLLYGVILPFRLPKTRHAYEAIWSEQGSPLRHYGESLCDKLQQQLGADYRVALGMRYGNPSIADALCRLKECENVIILPLYPQYSSAATGSSIEAALHLIAQKELIPNVRVITDFYRHPGFIQAQCKLIQPYIATNDLILFSYHGLPTRHLRQTGCKETCQEACPISSSYTRNCYRAQCYATTSYIADSLNLKPSQHITAFQSRLGRTPWIQPYTDEVLASLVQRNIKRIAVVCPSFVADCLETLEEIGMRAQERWLALGGESLSLIPCLNTEQLWCDAIQSLITTPTTE